MTAASDRAGEVGDGPVGIGGWLWPLLVLIVFVAVMSFLEFAGGLFASFGLILALSSPSAGYAGLGSPLFLSVLANLPVFAFAVASIVLMLMKKPAFVPVAIAFFALFFVSSLIDLWAGIASQPTSGGETGIGMLVGVTALTALVSEIAFLYLRRSRRVRNTFLLSPASRAQAATAAQSSLADKHS